MLGGFRLLVLQIAIQPEFLPVQHSAELPAGRPVVARVRFQFEFGQRALLPHLLKVSLFPAAPQTQPCGAFAEPRTVLVLRVFQVQSVLILI